MRHTWYFLIEPKPDAVREFANRVPGDHRVLLLEPFLTSRTFADMSAWRVEELTLVVKLLYLARIREYTPFADNARAKEILGSDRISVEVFDRWWSICALQMEEGPSEQMLDYLKPVMPLVVATGNPVVDDWLERLSGT